METEKETKVEETVEDSKDETSTQETVEEKITKLAERVEAAERLAREKDEGFKTLQRKYDKLYKSREEPQTKDTSRITKGIMDEIERLGNISYSDDPSSQARIKALREQLAIAEREEAHNAQLRKQQMISDETKESMEDKIRNAGLDPDDEKFDVVWTEWRLSALADGKFESVEKKLERILSKSTPKETEEEKPVEDEEKIRERIKREVIEEMKLNKNENPAPSGVSKTDEQIRKNYRENPGDQKALREYQEMLQRRAD